VPYSETASITEYIHRLPFGSGEPVWLLVITAIDDPKYLTQPFYTSTQFKLEADGSKWAPTPCKTPAPPGSLAEFPDPEATCFTDDATGRSGSTQTAEWVSYFVVLS
jgi:hypothetical protein